MAKWRGDPGLRGHPSRGYGATLTSSVKATRAAPATSGAFASAVTLAEPIRVPAQRSDARAVPSAARRHPDGRTKTGAELCTDVHRLSSTRGRRTRDTTVPGRTHNVRFAGSPGSTTTSVCPEAQLRAEAGGETVAGAEGLFPVGLAGALEAGAGEGCVDAPAEGPLERFPDGPGAGPPPDVVQAARTNAAAITHPPVHHRI